MKNITHYLKEIVFGGNDGIVTTFAVVSGFNGALAGDSEIVSLTFATVLLFGMANLFADALSMGLGNFVSVRSGIDVFNLELKRLRETLELNPDEIFDKSVSILVLQGFSHLEAKEISSQLRQNPDFWLRFIADNQGFDNPDGLRPIVIGAVTFLSFTIFGLLPLSPYFFDLDAGVAFGISVTATVLSLLCLGFIRASLAQTESRIKTILENLLVGGLAAVVSYFVGTFSA